MAAKDSVDRLSLFPQGAVPDLADELRQSDDAPVKSRLLRFAPALEVTLAVTRAVVNEAEEGERLRPLPVRACLPLGASTKPDQVCLVRFQSGRKLTQPLAQEPKYGIRDRQIVNRRSGRPIPDDEPTLIIPCEEPVRRSNTHGLLQRHRGPRTHASGGRPTRGLQRFAREHPERMKHPRYARTTAGSGLRWLGRSSKSQGAGDEDNNGIIRVYIPLSALPRGHRRSYTPRHSTVLVLDSPTLRCGGSDSLRKLCSGDAAHRQRCRCRSASKRAARECLPSRSEYGETGVHGAARYRC